MTFYISDLLILNINYEQKLTLEPQAKIFRPEMVSSGPMLFDQETESAALD